MIVGEVNDVLDKLWQGMPVRLRMTYIENGERKIIESATTSAAMVKSTDSTDGVYCLIEWQATHDDSGKL